MMSEDYEDRNPKLVEFEMYLSTDVGFRNFLDFALNEMSEENLLCWKLTKQYKSSCLNGDGNHRDIAIRIYEQFLRPDAPLLVNISHNISRQYQDICRQVIGSGDEGKDQEDESGILDELTFEDLGRVVMGNMFNDAYVRFAATNEFKNTKNTAVNMAAVSNIVEASVVID